MASKIREILKILGIWRKENPYVFAPHYNKISVFSCIIFHAFKSKFNICIIEFRFYFLQRGSGETGRRTRLRIWRRKAWRFKSSLPHHYLNIKKSIFLSAYFLH